MDPIDMMITDINCECLGLSRLCLMESAGKSLAEEVGKIAVYTFSKPVKIAIFTGSGGNGGDGFVAARYLLNRGYDVDIYMLTDKDNIHSDNAKTNFEIITNMEPRLSHLTVHYFFYVTFPIMFFHNINYIFNSNIFLRFGHTHSFFN